MLAVLVAVVAAALLALFIYSKFRVPKPTEDSNPIIDKIFEEP